MTILGSVLVGMALIGLGVLIYDTINYQNNVRSTTTDWIGSESISCWELNHIAKLYHGDIFNGHFADLAAQQYKARNCTND